MSPSSASARHLQLLLVLAGERLRGALSRPTASFWLGVALPMVVLLSALWGLGRVGALDASGVEGGVTLGLLVAAPISFMAYGLLFRGSDDVFLRSLGIDSTALYWERSLRLGLASLVVGCALVLPFASGGYPLARPLGIGIAAALATWGAATLTLGWAARATAGAEEPGILAAGMRTFDPELARAAPLVYAPLLPFLVGAVYGGFTGAAEGTLWMRAAGALLPALLGTWLGARSFATAAPRFLAQAGEMAYSPPPAKGGEAFRVGRGLSRFLPRRSAAAWVRDAAVAGRRFTWASRVTWPVVIAAFVALARWGDVPATRVWVLAAVGMALVVQAAAAIALGVMERGGPRWIDRSLGLSWLERFLGRWAWSWGLSLWLLVPVALAWHWWSGLPGAWAWPIAGAVSAAVAAGASLLNSERR
jgi:hypothetical protein